MRKKSYDEELEEKDRREKRKDPFKINKKQIRILEEGFLANLAFEREQDEDWQKEEEENNRY
jgi:hypothetical protein